MDIGIGILGLLLFALVILFLASARGEGKQLKGVSQTMDKKIADLEAEILQKGLEVKKAAAEAKKLEEDFLKARDEADIFKKENSELTQKLKQSEKLKEELIQFKTDTKKAEGLLGQEKSLREKIQEDLAQKDTRIAAAAKQVETLNQELKAKAEALCGLQGQYNELEAEFAKVKEGVLEGAAQPKVSAGRREEELPGFPKPADAAKIELKEGGVSDTDFLGDGK